MGFSVSLDWEIYVYVAYCATVLNVEGWLCDDDTEHVQPNRMFWAIVISSCFFSLDSFFFEEASEIPRKLSKTIKNMPSSFHTSISHSRRDRFGFSILVHSVLIGWTWCDLSLFPHFTSLFSCSLHFFFSLVFHADIVAMLHIILDAYSSPTMKPNRSLSNVWR